MPHKYLPEMRLMPPEKLSAVRVIAKNMVHRYTNTSFIMESDLHFRVIQNKLTPNLPKYLEMARTEVDYACTYDIPTTDDWNEVDIQPVIRMMVARITSTVMIGFSASRDQEWLKMIINFPVDMSQVMYTLRRFPPWLHPFIAPILPAKRKLNKSYRAALAKLTPLMDKHRQTRMSGNMGTQSATEENDTLLGWMLDHGNETQTEYEEMSARQILLTLASIHTTSMTVTNILFDLCEYPQWFSILRAEIEDTVGELGPLGTGPEIPQWLSKLEKMNGFIVETQRFRPPVLLSPQREAVEEITFKDGTRIEKGSRISWPAYSLLNSDAITPNPEVFDPLRSYRKRLAAPDQRTKHLAGQTDINNLTFGYGKLACPGRVFAVAEVQVILVKILTEFDFKFPQGKSRPGDMFMDEHMVPDPTAKLMMRTRAQG
ncbi:cytochrome P450 [Xylaria cf. heliscus]|nr:cytochrome P450 [Xylaria cf. heliscus]